MMQIATVVIGFVLTGVVGNWLVQRWQARNWLLQQRFLGHEKEYLALKELAEEIATLLGTRIFHMQRLNWALAREDDEKLKDRVRDHDQAVARWNERLTSFYVRLPLLAPDGFAQHLEYSIQTPLVKVGYQLEQIATIRAKSSPIPKRLTADAQRSLYSIQGKAIQFNKDLLKSLLKKRSAVYFGQQTKFSERTLSHFSTWHLFKALFVRDIDSMTVVRTPLDS